MQDRLDLLLDLVEQGQYAQALAKLAGPSGMSLGAQAVASLIEVEVGDHQKASGTARALLTRRLPGSERVLCLFTLGRAAYMSGNRDEACRIIREAVKLCDAVGHQVLRARAQSRLTKTLLHRSGIETALPELVRLRSFAYAAGDGRTLADFYCLAAEVETKQGRYGAALNNLRVATTLSNDQDLTLRAIIHRLTANVFLRTSEPRRSLESALEAVTISEKIGANFSLMASLSTLAQAHAMLGSHRSAEAVLSRMVAFRGPSGLQLAAVDTLMHLALARGDATEAAARADAIDTIERVPSDEYYWLWHAPTRAQWLISLCRASEALTILRSSFDAAIKTFDQRLVTRFGLAETAALLAEGAKSDAAERLQSVLITSNVSLEDFVEVNRLAAGLSEAASIFEQRSERIRSIAFSTETREYPFSPQAPDDISQHVLLHSAAALFSVCSHPELLAHEIAALLQSARCADDVSIIECDGTRPSGLRKGGGYSEKPTYDIPIYLKANSSLGYSIVATLKRDPKSRLAVVAIDLLAKSAVALAEAQLRASQEPSLWPDTMPDDRSDMIVAATKMLELVAINRRVASSNVVVLYTGETGTGKELLARALHDASPRRDKPFIPFNCTAVSREMLDSQLFGYRRGAFTGAHEPFQGVIRAAAGGTLLLDEIGEIPLDVQPKLLRFLESGEIHPLGEGRPIAVDVRIVAATNANLEQLVAEGKFREDLFYRLNVVRLQVPPLRERREEIPLLAQHFIDRSSREAQKSGIRLAEETMEYLVLYAWPGNVRQLANEMRRMVALAESGAVLMPEHLSREIAASRRTIPASQREIAPTEFVVRMDQPMSAAIEHLERSMIQYALTLADGRMDDAAQLLGLSRKGLYLKRQRLNMVNA